MTLLIRSEIPVFLGLAAAVLGALLV